MLELLTAARMRTTEQAAIESGAVTGLELMERAGQGVVDAVFEEWPELAQAPQSAIVLCGPGNNGGDGFVVARLLQEMGWQVDVFLFGDPENLPPDARVNYEGWETLGDIHDIARFSEIEPTLEPALMVDALFGTGLVRPLADPALVEALSVFDECVNDWWLHETGQLDAYEPARSVSIDIPSGLDSDSGRILGEDEGEITCAVAMLTVSFHRLKLGHVLGDGPDVCGRAVVKDIGLEQETGDVRLVSPQRMELVGKSHGHKFDHGHALVLSGGFGKTGAARLAARGALRIGAGLVTLGVPGAAQMEVASQITALMMTRVDHAEGLAAVLEDARITALCLGPGLGVERARALVPVALGAVQAADTSSDDKSGDNEEPVQRAVVLDADALTAFADAPEALFDMLHDRCVLTPHAGEFARLFPDLADKLNAKPEKGPVYSKVDAVREAAERAGCVVLFKGPDTVIAQPNGTCAVHASVYEREAPWLATAGAGDVLAGFITGLLARGLPMMQAAEAAAWLHVECAGSFGPGLIAEDLPEMLPDVLASMMEA